MSRLRQHLRLYHACGSTTSMEIGKSENERGKTRSTQLSEIRKKKRELEGQKKEIPDTRVETL